MNELEELYQRKNFSNDYYCANCGDLEPSTSHVCPTRESGFPIPEGLGTANRNSKIDLGGLDFQSSERAGLDLESIGLGKRE